MFKFIKSQPSVFISSILLLFISSIFPSQVIVVNDVYHYKYGFVFHYLTIYKSEIGLSSQSFFAQWNGEFYVNLLELAGSYAVCLTIAFLVHILFKKLFK